MRMALTLGTVHIGERSIYKLCCTRNVWLDHDGEQFP
jgi:hypothetical protein